jgi:hypothetical protein
MKHSRFATVEDVREMVGERLSFTKVRSRHFQSTHGSTFARFTMPQQRRLRSARRQPFHQTASRRDPLPSCTVTIFG